MAETSSRFTVPQIWRDRLRLEDSSLVYYVALAILSATSSEYAPCFTPEDIEHGLDLTPSQWKHALEVLADRRLIVVEYNAQGDTIIGSGTV
jgi:hypothetical protein